MGVLKGERWLPRDVTTICYEAGWKEPINLALFVATVGGESAYYSEAEGDPHSDGTIDLGLFQLNSIHAQSWNLSEEQFRVMAFNPNSAVRFARILWNEAKVNGHNPFTPWYAYSNGGYKHWLAPAIIGVANFLFITEAMRPNAYYLKTSTGLNEEGLLDDASSSAEG